MEKDKLTPKELTTLEYYDQNAEEWSKKHGLTDHLSYFEHDLKKFFRLLPKGRILEVGSGHGGDARLLIKKYGVKNYIGVDASLELLKIAQERNPGATFLHASIYELDFLTNTFDGFWVSAMLVHVPKSRLNEALKVLIRVTKRGGIGFISIMEGESDMQESRPGRFYTLWKEREFEKELKKEGFGVIYKSRTEPGSSISPWLGFIVRKV